ncbi:MAG TPA: 50S ribosomal protein L15 [Planctomycetota bacterium]|nr:50S ribosomal protein L15 [Planctomycetota bacterium]
MNLTDARKAKIPRKKKFPKGRGESSGVGKTAGRGRKGQWARTGTSFRPYFEGGQMSIIRRLPKRGFNNKEFRTAYEIVHLSEIATLFEAGQTVDEASLRAKGLVRRHLPIKLLGDGAIDRKLTFKVHRASKSALDKVAKAGGTVEMLTPPPPTKPARVESKGKPAAPAKVPPAEGQAKPKKQEPGAGG